MKPMLSGCWLAWACEVLVLLRWRWRTFAKQLLEFGDDTRHDEAHALFAVAGLRSATTATRYFRNEHLE
jgi:hypothetical protein